MLTKWKWQLTHENDNGKVGALLRQHKFLAAWWSSEWLQWCMHCKKHLLKSPQVHVSWLVQFQGSLNNRWTGLAKTQLSSINPSQSHQASKRHLSATQHISVPLQKRVCCFDHRVVIVVAVKDNPQNICREFLQIHFNVAVRDWLSCFYASR